jgi:hypothetical protein
MLIVDMSEVKLPGEANQNNLPPECGQPIDAGGVALNARNPFHARGVSPGTNLKIQIIQD